MAKRAQVETGTVYFGGSCLGPAERDPETGIIESGPHVAARAAKSGVAVVSVDRSPMNPQRWSLTLACGHDVWVTSAQKPKRTTSPCDKCPKEYP